MKWQNLMKYRLRDSNEIIPAIMYDQFNGKFNPRMLHTIIIK